MESKLTTRFTHSLTVRGLKIFCIIAALFLTACEDSDEASAIDEAQDCLNNITSSNAAEAANCRASIANLTSPEASVVICSSFFLQEGFFGDKILAAINRIDDTSSSENDMLNFASVFAFSSTSNASEANTACQRTGIEGFQLFGDTAVMATTIGSAFPGGLSALFAAAADGETPDVDDFKTALNNISSSADLTALGSSISSIATNLCTAGETEEDVGEDICPTVEAVTANSSNETIGSCVKECLLNGKDHVCTADTSITCP